MAVAGIASAGVFGVGLALNYTMALAIVHELCHAVVALAVGSRGVWVYWTYMYHSELGPFRDAMVTYAGYFGEVVVFTGLTFALAAARKPVLAAFGLGALVPPLLHAPGSDDFTIYAPQAVAPAIAELMTWIFVVVWLVAFVASVAAYAISLYARFLGLKDNRQGDFHGRHSKEKLESRRPGVRGPQRRTAGDRQIDCRRARRPPR
jgi:hypothetical protein